MDVNSIYHRSVEYFADGVNEVKDDQWGDPTPCSDWTVRDLANHVTSENLWTVPLLEGATIEEDVAGPGDEAPPDPVVAGQVLGVDVAERRGPAGHLQDVERRVSSDARRFMARLLAVLVVARRYDHARARFSTIHPIEVRRASISSVPGCGVRVG